MGTALRTAATWGIGTVLTLALSARVGADGEPPSGEHVRVRGRVIELPSRKPIPHATVYLLPAWSDQSVSLRADADGRFEESLTKDGAYRVAGLKRADGTVDDVFPIRRALVANGYEWVELVFAPDPVVPVRVVDATTGLPVAEARWLEDFNVEVRDLTPTAPAPAAPPSKPPAGDTSGVDGRLRIHVYESGSAGWVLADGFAPMPVRVDPETPEDSAVTMLPAGSLRILGLPAEDAADIEATIRHVATRRRRRVTIAAREPVFLAAVPAGDYEIDVDRRPGSALNDHFVRRCRVVAQQTTEVAIPTAPGSFPAAVLRGTVTLGEAWGLTELRVKIDRCPGAEPATVPLVGGRGSFAIPSPAGEDVALVLGATGFVAQARGEPDSPPLDVRIPDPALLSVRVLDAKGRPATDAGVQWTWSASSPAGDEALCSAWDTDRLGTAAFRVPEGFVSLQARREGNTEFSSLEVRSVKAGETVKIDLRLGPTASIRWSASVRGRRIPLGPLTYRYDTGDGHGEGSLGGTLLEYLETDSRPGFERLHVFTPVGFAPIDRLLRLEPGQVLDLRLEYVAAK